MRKLGIDMGTSTIKLVLLRENKVEKKILRRHYGRLVQTLRACLESSELMSGESLEVMITGANAHALTSRLPELDRLGDIPAIVEGVKSAVPVAGSVIDVGGQGARYITRLHEAVPEFNVNEHCAGGTGSFFEDQMSRLGLRIENYSELVRQARSVPRLSGRCAVFAKTDIIHRQQEGVPTPDILLGLCYAMIRNYKATIVKNLPVEKPVVFIGGVTQNEGAVQAIREVFQLRDEELIVPDDALFLAAHGCARKAEKVFTREDLFSALDQTSSDGKSDVKLPKLVLKEGTILLDPEASGVIPDDGCALGIDIGSTSTDFVLTGRDGSLIDFQYLRTAGDPEGAVRRGLNSIRERFGALHFLSVGVTGSGRERIGQLIGADAVRDEITAQACAAARWVPDVDTVFEIGGQDSKYISLSDSEVADFQMNKICAAGTGSFIEEQAARMDIPLTEFGPLALTAHAPSDLGERCTVFIETAIDSAQAEGAAQADIAAGLCHSIVKNYLHKVVGNKPIGKHIVLQGGVAYNPGIVAAFQSACGDDLTVSPCFSISGAYGAALLALEANPKGESSFVGYDFPSRGADVERSSEDVERNLKFYRMTREAFYKNYDGSIDPSKKTVGIPYALMMHKFFPLANAFFKALGYNVVLSDPSSEETIRLAQQAAQGETCYPVKLIYGHMMQLIEKKVDYIFMPNVHTVKHELSHVAANYGCVYMQSAASSIGKILKLEERGITLLAPVFDLDMGKEAMATAMIGVGKQLGKPKPLCAAALMAGAMAVRQYDAAAEKMGKELLAGLKPSDKVLVMITRNYGVSDPVLNMGIPELLVQRGYKVINLEHLPGHSIDVERDHPNLYWPFGQHILSGAKLIAHHPNLYAVYLTNHGCGPDTMLSYMFREEMGSKPYLQIEVDEHFSRVGVITRIEAFLNSLSHRETTALPDSFVLKDVAFHEEKLSMDIPSKEIETLYVPDFGLYTKYLCDYIQKAYGIHAAPMPPIDRLALVIGRTETTTKEYLPFTAMLGGILRQLGTCGENEKNWYLIPSTQGAEADGQYARAIRAVLNRRGYANTGIAAPILETLPLSAKQPELLLRALLTADLLYQLPAEERDRATPSEILREEELLALAQRLGEQHVEGRLLLAVGTPMCETSLDEGVLNQLESEGEHILRAPLAEYLLFLWQEDMAVVQGCGTFLRDAADLLEKIAALAGNNSAFTAKQETLHSLADSVLDRVSGGNARYRFAKAVEFSEHCSAVLSLAPRYENAAMVMEMRGLRERVKAPLYPVNFDGDWDETAWARLRSFLYYC